MNKTIKMFKNGEWIPYDCSDVDKVIIEETITMAQLKKYYPEKYKEFKKKMTNQTKESKEGI